MDDCKYSVKKITLHERMRMVQGDPFPSLQNKNTHCFHKCTAPSGVLSSIAFLKKFTIFTE